MAVLLTGWAYEGNTAIFRGERKALMIAAKAIADRECADQIAHNERMLELHNEAPIGDTPEVIWCVDMPFHQLKVGSWYVRVVEEAPVLTSEALDSFIQTQYDRSET